MGDWSIKNILVINYTVGGVVNNNIININYNDSLRILQLISSPDVHDEIAMT